MTAWFRAFQIVFWAAALVYWPPLHFIYTYPLELMGKRLIVFSPRILTLSMLAVSTPCIDFYRTELRARYESLRNGGVLSFTLAVSGAMMALFGARWPKNPMPTGFAGLAMMVLAWIWYRHVRIEFPRVEAELEDLEALKTNE